MKRDVSAHPRVHYSATVVAANPEPASDDGVWRATVAADAIGRC
ncbi:hypothetical protein ACQPZ2_38150 [Nocardia pseudovaccinii]